VKVLVQKKVFGPAPGTNKKEGEQAAAKLAYEELVGP
jgi:dsRNA-specific ribonuclease